MGLTPAEKQAAYRARQRPEVERLERVVAQDAGLEAYVAREVGITRVQLELGQLKDPDGKTLERCEGYARWRWAGFLAGEVASL